MASNKKAESASEVIKDTGTAYDGLRYELYSGTKKALVAEGVCKAEWFPAKLVPELRKDGKPHNGNNGRPRLKRTYSVNHRDKLITLTHRTDAYGKEYWKVQFCDAKAVAERDAKDQAERRERMRDYWRNRQGRNAPARATAPALPACAHIEKCAAFEVGDRAIVHKPGYVDHGDPVKVLTNYGPRMVDTDGGSAELWGYLALDGDGATWFFSPHELREFVERPFHIRLAVDNTGR